MGSHTVLNDDDTVKYDIKKESIFVWHICQKKDWNRNISKKRLIPTG